MNNVIEDKSKIVELWKEAFGDSEEDICFFADNVKDSLCLGIIEQGSLVSMLYLVDCYINGKRGSYVYAACTAKRFQGKGYMTALLKNAYEAANGFLCLIPADENLVEYYKRRGFYDSASVSELRFNQADAIKEYLFDGCELKKPIVLIKEKKG